MGAGAPHEGRFEIDLDKPVRLEGTVARVDWVDPVWIDLDVAADGRRERWRIKAGAPSTLNRRGWDRNSLPVGTRVAANGFLADAERKIVWAPELRLRDGRVLWLPNVLNDVDLAGSRGSAFSNESAVSGSCPRATIGGLPADPEEARRAGDYRPLAVWQPWGREPKYPAIACPVDRPAALQPKGGVSYSDLMAECPGGWGEMTFEIEATISAYNRELASWPEFQAETGCGPAR